MTIKQDQQDQVFLEVAKSIAKLSHCAKTHVGAVAVLNGRVIASGVNGTPPGHPNCDELHIGDFDHAAHRLWADENEIHGEQNLINDAARRGISLEGADVYVTMEPCKICSKNLLTLGIKRIVYDAQYDRFTDEERRRTKEMIEKSGVSITHSPQHSSH